MVKPYSDQEFDGYFIRQFDEKTEQSELVWHRDHRNRRIKVLEGSDWFFQYDNDLPLSLKIGDEFEIKANEFHRLIRGNSSLKLLIIESL